MAKEVNIVILCDELFDKLKAKGCGMTPIQTSTGEYNGTFLNIVLDALNKSRS